MAIHKIQKAAAGTIKLVGSSSRRKKKKKTSRKSGKKQTGHNTGHIVRAK